MNNEPEMKLTGVMHFDSRPHLTYTLGDTELISMRPLVDQIGLDWRTQKKGLLDDDSILFYGTLLLEDGSIVQPPCSYQEQLPFFSREVGFCAEKFEQETLFIRLDRVHMFLMRVDFKDVAEGKRQAFIENLLALQDEWAHALYCYETVGVCADLSRSDC